MSNDWFRKKTWDKEDEEDFFTRLKKVKKFKGVDYNRPEYLTIQAFTLFGQNNKKLDKASKALLEKYFTDFPDNKNERTQCLNLMGRLLNREGDVKGALEYYKKAAEYEIEFPYAQCDAYLEYCEFIIKHNFKKLYPDVERLIKLHGEEGVLLPVQNIKTTSLTLPIQKYRAYAMLSIIYKAKKDKEEANHYKDLAEEAAGAEKSGFVKHPSVGLVVKRDNVLDKLMK